MALAAQLKTGKAHVGAFQRPDAPIQPLAFGLKLCVGRLQPFDVGLQAAQQIQVGILPQQLLFSVQIRQPSCRRPARPRSGSLLWLPGCGVATTVDRLLDPCHYLLALRNHSLYVTAQPAGQTPAFSRWAMISELANAMLGAMIAVSAAKTRFL